MPIITSPEETYWQPTGLSSGAASGRNGHHYKASQQIRFRGDVKVLVKPLWKSPAENTLSKYVLKTICVCLVLTQHRKLPLSPSAFWRLLRLFRKFNSLYNITFAKENPHGVTSVHLQNSKKTKCVLTWFSGNDVTRCKTTECAALSGNAAENL